MRLGPLDVMMIVYVALCLTMLIVAIAGCTTEQSALQPAVESEPITGFATEACTRRIAQLAAAYNARGVTSYGGVGQQAQLINGNKYSLTYAVTIDYGAEQRTARVTCIVTEGGRVETIEGMG